MVTAHDILTDADAYRAAYPSYGRPAELFARCPLPGCQNPAEDPRQPCGDCLEAFGPWLQLAGETVSAEEAAAQYAERDSHVLAILAARREMEAGGG